jgi:hypothetical protein
MRKKRERDIEQQLQSGNLNAVNTGIYIYIYIYICINMYTIVFHITYGHTNIYISIHIYTYIMTGQIREMKADVNWNSEGYSVQKQNEAELRRSFFAAQGRYMCIYMLYIYMYMYIYMNVYICTYMYIHKL